MNYKNALLGVALVLSLLPIQSFSGPISNNDDNQKTGLYISGQYKPGVQNFNILSATETNINSEKLLWLKSSFTADIKKFSNFSDTSGPNFQDSSTGFGAAVGYLFHKGIRLEIEASYEKFDINIYDQCEGALEPCRHFALVRPMNIHRYGQFTVLKNTGLSVTSIMFNGCYNILSNKLEVSPYVCVGIGQDLIDFFEATHVKLAYQGKIGISYSLLPDVTLFVDGYYHRVINNQFKNLKVLDPVELKYSPKITTAIVTMNVIYFGGEAGIRFTF
ncbi:P44/Msp2 family outer membrane protein [Ehrlichia ruminantium]|uniref:P44/Msp2 family outer membrane protein n=1 Tax=Ehrlichia ruminantium TaxID=779 RepID=A0AAE6UIQ0_EHRRU|nr:P44/Msp2 family outer membrane protein [Ehrlichia ruminantium]QGR02930.1 P44/Msp2 family outer membrane protein [Ehrlichia ruminantium]QGR03854.1 P44/Msp2 family outer membrane protein [Ehrlichia ruminantium]QGR04781.1 P44/Msp2 family outer membrane protein [Ehrlichia ruminantium]